MSKINLPKIDSNEQNVEKLVDKLLIMRKELEYALMHLNEENVPVIKDVKNNIIENAEEISLRVEKDDVINQINISTESIDIIGTRVNLVGAVTVLSEITGELGTITAGTVNSITINSSEINSTEINTSILNAIEINGGDINGININSANINISEDVSIGNQLFVNDKVILSQSNFGNGIRWATSGDGTTGDPEIYIDPASESIFIECAGGIYANGTKID